MCNRSHIQRTLPGARKGRAVAGLLHLQGSLKALFTLLKCASQEGTPAAAVHILGRRQTSVAGLLPTAKQVQNTGEKYGRFGLWFSTKWCLVQNAVRIRHNGLRQKNVSQNNFRQNGVKLNCVGVRRHGLRQNGVRGDSIGQNSV